MSKFKTDAFFKARVEDLLYYRYRNMMVVRTISGFTKETRNSLSKYDNCTKSASEFGRVSSLCKKIRVALSGILPKQNNLTVVNSLTKKMRQVVEHDTINPRGERNLASALAAESGRQLLKDYPFNPDTTIALDYVPAGNAVTITTKGIKYPKGIRHIGFRLHRLAFDFETAENELVSGEWIIGNGTVVLDLPILADANGVAFTILEAQFFRCVDGEFVPMVEDVGKGVLIIHLSL